MATTPQGDDSDVRYSVMQSLTRAVARQRMATSRTTAPAKPRKLTGTYTLATSPQRMAR